MNRKNISLTNTSLTNISLTSIFLIMSLLALAACSGNLSVQEPQTDDAPQFSAAFAEEPGTRVTYTDDGTAIKLAWNRDDCIGIWTSDASGVLQSNSRYKADEDGSVTAFSYTKRSTRLRWASETAPQSFYACWPWSEERGANPSAVSLSLPAVQTQETTNVTEHLAANDFMWAAAEGLVKSDSEIGLQFHHAFSVLDLELANDKRMTLDAVIFRCTSNPKAPVAFENASIDLATGVLDLSGASLSPEIRLECGFATSWPASSHLYMVINPALGGETVQVLAVAGGKELLLAEKKVPEGGFPAGKAICLKADFKVPDEVATKIVDLGELGTANSYIVSKANEYYKFRATVKGNGNIPSELSSVAGEASITPKSLLILWYNTVQDSKEWVEACPILPSSLVLVDGYAYFDTPKKFIPGNVVIAAFAEEGVTYDSIEVDSDYNITNATLLWSWNIWAAEDYSPESNPIVAGGSVFMDRNLGAVISGLGSAGEYEPAYAVGNFYQWGRKDPFPSFSDYCNYWPCKYANQLLFTPTYTPIAAMSVNGQSSARTLNNQMFGYKTKEDGSFSTSSWHMIERNSIADPSVSNSVYSDYAVAHPYVCILNTTYSYTDGGFYPWLTTNDQSYRAFWGGFSHDKTLFDPCPVGWRVCDKTEAQAFIEAVLSKAVLSSNLVGYEFDGHYLPITSTRNHIDFMTDNVRSCGYVTKSYMWTSESNTNHNFGYAYAAAIIAPANYANPDQPDSLKEVKIEDNKYLASGCPVRCVKE